MSDSTQTLPKSAAPAGVSSIHRNRLLWAGFMAILSTGVGFAIRGGIFANWGAEYGFTGAQLGQIGGAGLTGFCFGVVIGGVIADKVGYGKLVCAAFLLHIISAIVTFATNAGMPQASAYNCLYWGMFIFAIGNGTLEAVANPLVATLFPENRTHYLNILHASWPAGLMIGGVAGAILGGVLHWGWKLQLALYLVPTVLYGIMFMGQKFPKSEASQKGLSIGEMFKDVGILGGLVICFLIALFFHGAFGLSNAASYGIAGVLLIAIGIITRFSIGAILLFVLFATHALVGAVELGTDQWIQNITGNILTPTMGKWLFVYTSLVMFCLRFSAHFVEKTLKLSPVGMLCVCAVVAGIGLNLISISNTTMMIMVALLVYACGKTFFWPTMLAVASDRFPRTGAVAISIMGGIGMMSAGMIGAPGLGYAKDRFAGEELAKNNPAVYQEYKADTSSSFLPFVFKDSTGLDGKKLAEAKAAPKDAAHVKEAAVAAADMQGDRKTLKADSVIPFTMAGIFLLIVIYFKSIGGYKIVHLQGAGGKEEIAA